jgi:parallel beta-helix repeat protein
MRRRYYMCLLIVVLATFVTSTLCYTESTNKTAPFTHKTKERLYNKSRSVNAVKFGLISESSVDQTSVLIKAIQHAANSPNIDTVYIPEGKYYIAQTILPKPGVNLIGEGPSKTIFVHKDEKSYLIKAKNQDFNGVIIANLTLNNSQRILLMQGVRNLHIHNVDFRGGIVRFEKSTNIILEKNIFNENIGKGGYASSDCKNVRIVNNRFNSIEKGSINLSGHQKCYVAFNHITSTKLIDSGYAGIRLPNNAINNLIENNFIENHGRGLFILSSSVNNILRNNTVKNTKYQGVLIQASNNLLEKNTIIDAGSESIYVTDATGESSPTPSIADENRILNNVIYDTKAHNPSRFLALKITSRRNVIKDNKVSKAYGRRLKSIQADMKNQDSNNVYVKELIRQ